MSLKPNLRPQGKETKNGNLKIGNSENLNIRKSFNLQNSFIFVIFADLIVRSFLASCGNVFN